MEPQIKPSYRASVLGFIAPQSATTVKVSGWLDATIYHNLLLVVQTGVITATGLVDATVQQASSNTGTGAKAVYPNNNTSGAAKAITELVATTNNNNHVLINVRQEDLDIANGFKWVQFSITPSVAAALISGLVMGFDPRNLSADNAVNANASQVQVVY